MLLVVLYHSPGSAREDAGEGDEPCSIYAPPDHQLMLVRQGGFPLRFCKFLINAHSLVNCTPKVGHSQGQPAKVQ